MSNSIFSPFNIDLARIHSFFLLSLSPSRFLLCTYIKLYLGKQSYPTCLSWNVRFPLLLFLLPLLRLLYFLSCCQRTQLAITYIYVQFNTQTSTSLLHVVVYIFYLFRNSSVVQGETIRQLLLIESNINENKQLIEQNNSMSTGYLINEQPNCSTTNELSSTNGHEYSLSHHSQPTSSSEQTTET